MIYQDEILLFLRYGAIVIALILAVVLLMKTSRFRNVRDELERDLALKDQEVEQLSEINIQLNAEKQQLLDSSKELSNAMTELKADYAVANQQQIDARRHADEKIAIQQKQADEKIELLQNAREEMTKEFNFLANKILENKAKNWREDSKQNMDTILNPLREQLTGFRNKVEDIYDKESKERNSLLHEIGTLKALNQQMSQGAINLTNALKGDSKAQGNWGEVVLERVLESSGLTKGREYQTQVNLRSESGDRYMPDVLVKLPDGKDIIIDAKVSLTDYERFCSAETEEERSNFLQSHINSIKTHIKSLGAKKYDNLEGINSLDFVFIFIPVEPAYMVAAEQEPQLFTDAIEISLCIKH